MDEGVKKLQEDLSHVEYDAELLLLARREVNEITQNILSLPCNVPSNIRMLTDKFMFFLP